MQGALNVVSREKKMYDPSSLREIRDEQTFSLADNILYVYTSTWEAWVGLII